MASQQQSIQEQFKITIGGFKESPYRDLLVDVAKRLSLYVILSNEGSARSSVQEGSAYIGIIGDEYPPIPKGPGLNPERLSLTEIELNEALKWNRPVLLLVREGPVRRNPLLKPDRKKQEKLDAFRARARELVSDPSAGRFFVTFQGPDFRDQALMAIPRLLNYVVDHSTSSQGQESQSPSTPTGKTETAPIQSQVAQPELVASQTTNTTKRLVFISASHQDYGWRDRLKSVLDAKTEIEWWDDSKIATGSNGQAEIDAAIKRASLAVVVLSPAYVASDTARSELTKLLAQSSSGRFRLLPIMLHEVEWNQMPPALSKLQIWSIDKPVGGLRGAAARKEIEKIAEGIVKAARESRSSIKAVSTAAPREAPKFSGTATWVLDRAKELAKESQRSGVTSSCLLFALTQQTSNETAAFVRDSMEQTGHYDKALDTFLHDSDSSGRQSETEVLGLGKASRNVAAVLANAANIASRVSQGPTEISPRHIFASLLVTGDGNANQIARRRLENLGIDLQGWRRDFLEHIRSHVQSEDLAGWAAILTLKTFQVGPAGYTSEFCGVGGTRKVEDHLGVAGWANQLAELIALRETKLPLAIGLFGNWGSGKSHFMNLIDKALKSRTDEEKQSQGAGTTGRWCTEIVPVYFNAWHYLDSNLWASLVAQIFESLFAYLGPKTSELETVQELLEQASGATARAAEEVKVAEGATTKARSELIVAEQTRLNEETVVDGLLHSLNILLPEVNSETLQKHAVDLLGVKKEVETVSDLREVVEESHSLSVRARALWNKLWKEPGRGWRLGYLTIVILGGAAIAGFMAMRVTFLKDLLGGRVASLLGGVSMLVLGLQPLVGEARRRMKQMEAWASRAETAQKAARETQRVKDATIKVSAATAKEEAAKIRLAEAMAHEALLKEEALNLAPERRLGRFIENKAQSLDYRGQLGLVSLARRDFQELSNIFADRDALEERIAKLPAKDKEAETQKITNLSRSIDRIVLYVDDLDRCQPEKVVEVLQAVHLLLAFPLFAVVVGVDQRCLRQSLRMQFKGLLTQETGSENGTRNELRTGMTDDERPATPLDYLEKIFHVPFHLPPMGELGFETLIDRLTAPPEAATSIIKPPERNEIAEEIRKRFDIPGTISAPMERPSEKAANDDYQNSGTKTTPSSSTVGTFTEPELETASDFVGSVPLQRWEREALRAYHPLIRTPRGAKRLLNTYRLVRASVPQSEWGDFSGGGMSDGEFRVAMLLLAAAAGYPALARNWFDRLLNTSPSELFLSDVESDSDLAWNQFKKVYEATFSHFTKPLTQDLFVKWVDRVERFAF
jgi:hypothetical protein